MADKKLTVGMVVFDGFELLDTFGPLQMFAGLKEQVSIVMIAEQKSLIKSNAGPGAGTDYTFNDVPPLDIVLIPGGMGTRREVNNAGLITALKELADKTPYVGSICTGAALLARTGILDNRKATTNKKAFLWVAEQGPKVSWVKKARWVEDGKYFTSSGVSAGMDMALAMISKILGEETAIRIANSAEYRWNKDSSEDEFAALSGLG